MEDSRCQISHPLSAMSARYGVNGLELHTVPSMRICSIAPYEPVGAWFDLRISLLHISAAAGSLSVQFYPDIKITLGRSPHFP